jgi:hypothetical protein
VLLRLLTFPITGPVHGLRWVIDQVIRAAEAERGQVSVRERMAAVRAAHDRGEIGPEELSARMDDLLDELLTGRDVDGGVRT